MKLLIIELSNFLVGLKLDSNFVVLKNWKEGLHLCVRPIGNY